MIKTLMLVFLLLCSCSNDDYEYGTPNDIVGKWTVSTPSAQLTILIDDMPADSFFPKDEYNKFSTTVNVTKAADCAIMSFTDDSFTKLFGLPSEITLQKGEDFAYATGTFEAPIPLSLGTPVSVEEHLPTLGNVLQNAINGIVDSTELPEELAKYLKNFNVSEQQIGGMELEAESWYFSMEMQHGMTEVQAVANIKVKMKGFSFYGANASLINMVLPMLVESEIFQQMNGFNLKITLNLKKN